MDLWNAIAEAPYPHTYITVAIIAAALAAIIGLLALAAWLRSGIKKPSPAAAITLGYTALTVLGVGAVTTLIVVLVNQHTHTQAIEDIVADYLHDELDLVPLAPVEYHGSWMTRSGRASVSTTAIQEDGELAEVRLHWLDVNTRPHDASWEIPKNFNPIEVIVTPLEK